MRKASHIVRWSAGLGVAFALFFAATSSRAERVTERATGTAPIWAEGEAPEDADPRPAPRRAMLAAISEAVAEATRALVGREDPYLDPEVAVKSLGDDLVPFAVRYRVVDDVGRVEAASGAPHGSDFEHEVTVEALVDLDRIRGRLNENGLLGSPIADDPPQRGMLVLEGEFSYRAYREIRQALESMQTQIGETAFRGGEVWLELDTPLGPRQLLRSLRGKIGPHLHLKATGGEGGFHVQVTERLSPSESAAAPDTLDAP